jgi:hypothetical protein
VPAGQSWHVPIQLAPTALEYFPCSHGRQSLARVLPSSVEYLPAAQSWHVSEDVADVAAEYLPAPQSVQSVSAPGLALLRRVLAGTAIVARV